ncbi:HU family DNA-binding protein [Bartonella sp. DGB1]|uniref:HU family DNA-binding protein n=1 Tax=Bartonella sp. DGB1 TaxID=3239807 RepID=UPI0035250D30
MNKTEFVNFVAEEGGLSKTEATKAVDVVLACITSALAKGEDIRIPGFGNFSVSDRAESKGRNPATGAEIVIPARRVPRFSAGKNLKDAVQK